MKSLKILGAVALLAFSAASAQAQYVNATVDGMLSPGVYGRVDISNAPPPPVLYQRPVIIVRQPQPVAVQPVYLYVPPGHAKDWRKHCGKYNACAQPVYFVNEPQYWRQHKNKKVKHDDRHDHDDDRGHGKNKNKNKD